MRFSITSPILILHKCRILGQAIIQGILFHDHLGGSWGEGGGVVAINDCSENKMLGRALDPRANGTWLSKLTE